MKKIKVIIVAALAFVMALGMVLPANATPTGFTYPNCTIGGALVDKYPLQNDGTDTVNAANSVSILQNWGPSPYVTFNGSSAQGVGGMLMGGTNLDLTGDFCIGMSFKTNDTQYNFLQWNTLKPGQAVVKLTAVSTYVQDNAGTQIRLGTGLTSPGWSNGVNHYLILQRKGDDFDIWGVTNGVSVHFDHVNAPLGDIDLSPYNLMILGKYQPNQGYSGSDMCGDGTPTCYVWNVQVAKG